MFSNGLLTQKYLKLYLAFTLYQLVKKPIFKNGGNMKMKVVGKFELLIIILILKITIKFI